MIRNNKLFQLLCSLAVFLVALWDFDRHFPHIGVALVLKYRRRLVLEGIGNPASIHTTTASWIEGQNQERGSIDTAVEDEPSAINSAGKGQRRRRQLEASTDKKSNHCDDAPSITTLLLIVTSSAEFDQGRRATRRGRDRFAQTLLPALRETAWSLRLVAARVDVVLITQYDLIMAMEEHKGNSNGSNSSSKPFQRNHYQLVAEALAEPPLEMRQELLSSLSSFDNPNPTTTIPPIDFELWPDATPLAYPLQPHDMATDDIETPLDQTQPLQPHTAGLARQHRFVLKDKLRYYDQFVCLEDDMILHGAQARQYWRVTQQLYRLRMSQGLRQEQGDTMEPNENEPQQARGRRTKSQRDSFYDNLTPAMLKRTMPGLFRVEVALPGWNRKDYPHYQENLYSQIPLTTTLWDDENGQDGNEEEDQDGRTKYNKKAILDAAPCCHVANETAHRQGIPPTPSVEDLYFWETSIDALGVRFIADLPKKEDHQDHANDHMDNILSLGWVLLQVGGLDQRLGRRAPDTISDYWVGKDGYFNGTKRPETMKGRYTNNQGGWIGTQRQIIEWHTEQCQRGLLPPYPADTIDKAGIQPRPKHRWPMVGGFQYDGLGYESVEYWSGGAQLYGPVGCNLKRVIPLQPEQFARHLVYHSSNNKQRQPAVQHRFSSRNIAEFWAQLNTVRRNAQRVMTRELQTLLENGQF